MVQRPDAKITEKTFSKHSHFSYVWANWRVSPQKTNPVILAPLTAHLYFKFYNMTYEWNHFLFLPSSYSGELFSSYSYFFFCFFYSNLLNASSTISSVSPFLRKNIFFSITGMRSIFSPPRKRTAIPIFFYLYYNFFSSSSSFFFWRASAFPIFWAAYLLLSLSFLYT